MIIYVCKVLTRSPDKMYCPLCENFACRRVEHDMRRATHERLVELGVRGPVIPPLPIILEEVIISPPGTPQQQIMPGTPPQPPSVGRRELVQQRLALEVAHEQLPRQLLFREVAETPGRLPVQRVENYPIRNLLRPLF